MENIKPVLIFGGGGQDGFYLKRLLEAQGEKVFSYSFSNPDFSQVDVGDYLAISKIIKLLKPSKIFHLAAKSTTKHSAMLLNQNAIVSGTVSILESVENYAPECRVFIASSGLIFQNDSKPIREDAELVTDTAYALARVQSLMCARYYRNRGLSVYVGFLFNHESHLRPEYSIAKQIVASVTKAKVGDINTIEIGNADVVKEWTYAEDSVIAILTLINQDDIFEANIGSGRGYSIREFADICCEKVGIKLCDFISENENYEPQYKSFISDPARINSLGWKSKVNIAELASRMLKFEV